jgi:hypothetical protein
MVNPISRLVRPKGRMFKSLLDLLSGLERLERDVAEAQAQRRAGQLAADVAEIQRILYGKPTTTTGNGNGNGAAQPGTADSSSS